jgi:hypothetical protein
MTKKRVIRQLIITIGFLPGLWLAIGIDPETQITYVVIDVVAKFISSVAVNTFNVQGISTIGDFVYAVIGAISAVCSWISVFELTGSWGISSVNGFSWRFVNRY